MTSLSKKVFADNVKVISGEVFLRAVYLFSFIIYARLMSPFELSVFPVFALISAIISMVSCFGLPVTVMREAPKLLECDRNKALSLIRYSTVYSIFGALLFSLVILVLAPQIAHLFFKDSSFDYLIRLMTLGVFLYATDVVFSYNLKALSRFHELTIKNTALGVSQRVLCIALFLLWGVKGLLIGLNISFALGVSFSLYFLRDTLFRKTGGYPMKDLLKFSMPYYADGFLIFFQSQSDQMIVATFLTPPHLAAYYVAKRLAENVEIFKESIEQTISPALSKISALGKTAMENSLKKIMTVISYFAIPLCLLAASSSFAFLSLMGQQKYLEATGVAILLCISSLFYFFIMPVTKCIFVSGKPVEKLRVTVVQSFCFVGFLLLFVSVWGETGAAIGRLVSIVLSLIYAIFVLKRSINVKVDAKAIGKSVLASSAMALFIGSAQMLYFDLTAMPMIIGIGIILWGIIFYMLLNSDDVELIASMLPKNRIVSYMVARSEKRFKKQPFLKPGQ